MSSVNDLEPGLALMDEIGRTALTNAFIHFIRNTCDPSAYRDSLIYAGCRVTNVDETTATDELAGELDLCKKMSPVPKAITPFAIRNSIHTSTCITALQLFGVWTCFKFKYIPAWKQDTSYCISLPGCSKSDRLKGRSP